MKCWTRQVGFNGKILFIAEWHWRNKYNYSEFLTLVSLIPKPRLTCVMYYQPSSDLIIQNAFSWTILLCLCGFSKMTPIWRSNLPYYYPLTTSKMSINHLIICERQIKCTRRRKLSLGGNGAENDNAKSKLGSKGFHGNKRHLSMLIMRINAHTYRTRGTGLKVVPTN